MAAAVAAGSTVSTFAKASSSSSVLGRGAQAAAPLRSVACASLGGKSSSLYGAQVINARNAVAQKASSTNREALIRAELGDSLEEFLAKATPDKKLARLLVCMGEALRTIAFKVRTASCGATACVNTFGDEQLAVDMLADKLLFEALRYSHVCKYACSEEEPVLQDMEGEGFSVAFDPLDGSSIVDTNFTVGTIFGVWPGDKLTGITGRDQAASAMGIYGPRTTYVIAINGFPGTHEFLLMDDGKWQHVKETTEIKEGKLFSPGNLSATCDNPDYEKLISYYVSEKYNLRYTGGMVPDVHQITVKERHLCVRNLANYQGEAKENSIFPAFQSWKRRFCAFISGERTNNTRRISQLTP